MCYWMWMLVFLPCAVDERRGAGSPGDAARASARPAGTQSARRAGPRGAQQVGGRPLRARRLFLLETPQPARWAI